MNHPSNQLGKKIQNYIFNYSDFLGAGNFSKCYKGINQLTNQIVAIKIVELNSLKSKKLQELLFQEIQILKKLNHPSVLKCFEIFTSNRNCYIITQLCNEGNLESKLKIKGILDENESSPIIRDVYNGLLYLAHNNIVHRDLKAANIFLHNGRAKIADFGFAKEINHNFKDFNIGSPLYMSPQGILLNVYGPKTEVWALGIFVYQLFHGTTPFSYCKTEDELKRSVSTPLNWNQLKSDLSGDIKQFILACLLVNEQKRITIQQLSNLNYIRRINQSQSYLNSIQIRSSSKSTHFAIKKMNQMLPVSNQRTNNNFRAIDNINTKQSLESRHNNNKVLFLSVDKRNNFPNSYSNPKRDLIVSGPQALGSPNRTMTMKPNYINQNNPLLLNSIQEVQNEYKHPKFPINNQDNQNKLSNKNSSLLMKMMISPNNQKAIQYQQQQTQRLSSYFNETSNQNYYSNKSSLDSLGYNILNGRFFQEINLNGQSNPGLLLKKKSSINLQNNIFIDKINFREAIFFIHHCRLLYKFLQIYKESPWFDQNLYLQIYRYLLTVLAELKLIIEKDWIIAEGQKTSNKIKKLAEVNIEYFNKYKNKVEEYGYHIEPQNCSETSLPFINKLINQLLNHLNNQIYLISRKKYVNQTDESLIILGHLAIIIRSSIQQIQKAISQRNYKKLSNFKQIEVVLNTSRQQFTLSSYQKYREKYVSI